MDLGNEMAAFWGDCEYIQGGIEGNWGAMYELTGGGQWDQVQAWINVSDNTFRGVAPHSTKYWLNKIYMGQFAHSPLPDDTVRAITLRQWRNYEGEPEQYIEFDDFVVTRCTDPGTDNLLCDHDPYADVDEDGDVDADDFAFFQLCFTGPTNPLPATPGSYCECLDVGADPKNPVSDNHIDTTDFTGFQSCASGPNVPADTSCDD
jgi:hypothetical protein